MSKREVTIIAMKGPPYTFKSRASSAMGKFLSCPVICIDDILDRLSPNASNSIPTPKDGHSLYDLALDLACRTTSSLLDQKIVDKIVIDSRLSSQSQFNRLVKLAGSFPEFETSLVIVECKPKNKYAWQMRFEESVIQPSKWYKPKSWDDVEKAIALDFDCDVLSLSSNFFRVSKLVLDPFTALQLIDLSEIGKKPLFSEPLKRLIDRRKDKDPCVVDFDQWRKQFCSSNSHLQPGKVKILMRKPLCNGGHSITMYMEEGLGFDANCEACDKTITGAAYNCDSCCLALHKACAEFDQPLDVSFRTDGRLIESFLENHTCSSCAQEGKNLPRKCESFLFQYNLKHRLMPTVVNHEGHEHFLYVRFLPIQSFGFQLEFQCMGCGHINVKDRACYSCKLCGFNYDINCVNLPHQVIDEHGGYYHRMALKYSSKEEEDYFCHRCSEKRDPRCWFYSCEEGCEYETHLRCDPAKVRVHFLSLAGLKNFSTGIPISCVTLLQLKHVSQVPQR